MKIKFQIAEVLERVYEKVLQDLQIAERPELSCELEIPQNEDFGDFASNLAMVLAKTAKRKPRDLAQMIVEALNADSQAQKLFSKIEIAGPGFINFTLAPAVLHEELQKIHTRKQKYGQSDIGHGRKVRIEFVSANPTGPLHVGHGRGAVIGDVLSSLYAAAGFDVIREYYVNDYGNQMNILGKTARAWIEALDQGQEDLTFPEEEQFYRGDYMKDVAAAVRDTYGKHDDDAQMGYWAGQVILKMIGEDLEAFGVQKFDRWFSETSLHKEGKVSETIEELKAKGMIEQRDGAWWFCSSKMGDDKDRVVVKSDGSLTYLAADMAYHREKYQDGVTEQIDIWGADHHGYVARIKAAIESLGKDPESLSVILCQLVRLMRSGKPVAMSTRSGDFVPLQDIVEEVGKDAARFFFMMRKSDAQLDFDLDVAKSQSMDNPVYYIQYAHARICSVQRMFEEKGLKPLPFEQVDFSVLKELEELRLIKEMSHYQDMIEGAVLFHEGHRMANYLQILAGRLHSFYNKCRVISEDQALSQARYQLMMACGIVLRNGLNIMGLSAPESM